MPDSASSAAHNTATSQARAPVRSWRVFLSSTGDGLMPYREAAIEVVRDIDELELVHQESWGARDWPARDYCVHEVRSCDVLVGIVGDRYGSHPEDDTRSYSEIEYDTAQKGGISTLIYLLAEGATPTEQPQDAADAQRRLRQRMGTNRICGVDIETPEQFAEKLRADLGDWLRNDSVPRRLVDRREEYPLLRQRLVGPREHSRPITIVCGAPGVGKTELIETLLTDRVVDELFKTGTHATVSEWEGSGGPVEKFKKFCDELGVSVKDIDDSGSAERVLDALWTRLLGALSDDDRRAVWSCSMVSLDLQDPWLSDFVPHLLRNQRAVAMLLETNDADLVNKLVSTLNLRRTEDVVELQQLPTDDDAMQMMARSAPVLGKDNVQSECREEILLLARTLGNHPWSLHVAASQIAEQVGEFARPDRVRAALLEKYRAVEAGDTLDERHRLLFTTYLPRLSEPELQLLRHLTVLHTRPAWFTTELAAVLARPIASRQEEEEEEEEDEEEAKKKAKEEIEQTRKLLVALERQGLLKTPIHVKADGSEQRPADMGDEEDVDPWTMHHLVVAMMQREPWYKLRPAEVIELHVRAEAFYRGRISNLQGTYDGWYGVERPRWRHDVTEWLYHLSHLDPLAVVEAISLVFLEAWWWWDLYVEFEASEHLLQSAVQLAAGKDTPPQVGEVGDLLKALRLNYPRQHEVATLLLRHRAGVSSQLSAEGDAELAALLGRRPAALLETTRQLREKLAQLLDGGEARQHGLPARDRDRLTGLIALAEAHAHRLSALTLPEQTALPEQTDELKLAAACYAHALDAFGHAQDVWDSAWTRYELAEIRWLIGPREDADSLWEISHADAAEEGDRELLANLERARAEDRWREGRRDDALEHYGRALFYAHAFHFYKEECAEEEPWAGTPDLYTMRFYEEVRLHCALPLLEARDDPAEARRRLDTQLAPWAGAWEVDEKRLEEALRDATVDSIASAVFPPGPGELHLGRDDTDFHRKTVRLLEEVATQPWVVGIGG